MTLETQFITMFMMIAFGVYIGGAYVFFKRIDKWWTKRIVLRYLLELLFWVGQALLLFYILYKVNEGIVRFYIFIALFCGYAMFKALFESTFKKWVEVLLGFAGKMIRGIIRCIQMLVIQPIVWIVSLIFMLLHRIFVLLFKLFYVVASIVAYPIRQIGILVYKLLPKKGKKIIYQIGQFSSKIRTKKK
jgi:spore cortex biosynthesis protein YabQ